MQRHLKEATVSKMLDLVKEATETPMSDYSLASQLYNIVYNDLMVEVTVIDLDDYLEEIKKNDTRPLS